jgi:hypothetical protein
MNVSAEALTIVVTDYHHMYKDINLCTYWTCTCLISFLFIMQIDFLEYKLGVIVKKRNETETKQKRNETKQE